jgi:hypothetical protein
MKLYQTLKQNIQFLILKVIIKKNVLVQKKHDEIIDLYFLSY